MASPKKGVTVRSPMQEASAVSPAWLGLLFIAGVLALLSYAATRATELFRLSVTHGQVRLERGRLPRPLFDELSDVIRRERLQQAEIRVVLEAGAPRLLLEAESRGAEQALRNVLGRFTLTQIRTGRMRGPG